MWVNMSNRLACTLACALAPIICMATQQIIVVRAAYGVLTEEEEGHFDEFFAQFACCRAHGRAIWETHGESRRKLTRRVGKLQGVIFFLEDVTS